MGKGQVQDEIDATCKQLFSCHSCASLDFSKCSDTTQLNYRYRFFLEADDINVDDNRQIECLDPWDGQECRRASCECDKGFIYKLKRLVKDWNPDFWAKSSDFDRESICKVAVQKTDKNDNNFFGSGDYFWGNFSSDDAESDDEHGDQNTSGKTNTSQMKGEKACCGSYEDDGNRFQFVKNDDRSCCGKKTYYSLAFECCDEETSDVQPFGIC